MDWLISISTFLPILSLLLSTPITASPRPTDRSLPHPHPHNPNNPHSHLLKKSITADPASVDGQSFDFIITGGGVAGLAVAARLSEWSNITVLVIEAGGDGSEFEDQIDIPGYSYLHSLTNSAYDWGYNTIPQVETLDLRKYWPRGKGLGGSGAINGLFWCRGAATEYDAWGSLNPGGEQTWNWEEMSKYINKAENFSQPNATVQEQFGMVLNASAHGSGGPIQSGFSEYIFDAVANWIPAWVNLGFPSKDLADGTTRGVSITPSTLDMRNGSRSDSKAGYIDPLPPRSNLVILTGQQVTKVNFNGSTDSTGNILASGVTFAASNTAQSHTVYANKEVILSGGTIGSAQLLQLSGIGPAALLTGLGITVHVDSPVGYNLQDHVSYSLYWSTPQGTYTWGNLSRSTALQAEALTEWREDGTGLWTYINEAVGYPSFADISSAAEATTYANTVNTNIATTVASVTSSLALPANVSTGLAAQYALQQQWLTEDNGQLEIILTMLGTGDNTMGIQVALQHPWSRGTVFINTTSAFDPPLINPYYFGVDYDVDIINYGSAFARKLAATAPLSDYMITETLPGAGVTGDPLTTYTKQNCGTEYHPLGTCAMLPRSSGGVVDTNLVVYGTSNLRVIDASIMPLHISAHLMASSYGVAEKGADIIKAKYMEKIVQVATSSTSEGASASASGSASGGPGSETGVTNANANAGSGGNGSLLSTGAKAGIGAGAGVLAIALIGGLIACLLFRRRKINQRSAAAASTATNNWYRPGPAGREDSNGAYKEARDDYAMSDLPPPGISYGRTHSSSPSMASMATADMMSGMPRRVDSGYNIPEYERHGSPYRDGDDWDASTPPVEYPQPPQNGYASNHQRYHPVAPR